MKDRQQCLQKLKNLVKRNTVKSIVVIEDEKEIKEMKEWLRNDGGLDRYIDNFMMTDFDLSSMIKEMDDKNDLEYVGILVNAHQIKLMNKIRKLT